MTIRQMHGAEVPKISTSMIRASPRVLAGAPYPTNLMVECLRAQQATRMVGKEERTTDGVTRKQHRLDGSELIII